MHARSRKSNRTSTLSWNNVNRVAAAVIIGTIVCCKELSVTDLAWTPKEAIAIDLIFD